MAPAPDDSNTSLAQEEDSSSRQPRRYKLKGEARPNSMHPRQRLADMLGKGGLLSKALDRYEFRPQQLEMAETVFDALTQKKRLIVEAATGTGKTVAYLIPALMSGRRVVVSTGTKALQEQLFHKDIPLLSEHWSGEFDAVLLKGRRNYLCKLRYEEMLHNPRFRGSDDARHWDVIKTWFQATETGDRAEIPGLPDDYPTWADLSVGSEACKASKCKHYESCFVTQARRRATEADIIVVNHHLFFADLALRQDGYAEILPEYDAVIFDEAHHLEEVASNYFGIEVSNWRVNELVNDIRNAVESEAVHDDDLEAKLKSTTQRGTSFFTLLGFGLYEGRYALGHVLKGQQKERIEEAHREFAVALTELQSELKRFAGASELSERLAARAAQFKFDVDELMQADDERFTYFMELRDRGVFLQAAPIDLAEIFQRRLLAQHDTLVFTSATLATGGNFSYFKQRMGLEPVTRGRGRKKTSSDEAIEVVVPKGDKDVTVTIEPPEEKLLPVIFDYEQQCLVYVPNRLPAPSSPKFVEGVAQIVEYLLGITHGSAFVLFTSWSNMNAVHEELEDVLPYTVLKQGERPKKELLDAFRADHDSVLFATSSFWEGVDVVGDALKLVIIDKLPFASPSDPLVRARMDLLESRGGNSFMDYSVPSAALTLKQGFGRLIRSHDDTGVVAILDSRIAHKRYGSYFLESLPPAPVVWRAAGVRDWWAEKFGDAPDDDA